MGDGYLYLSSVLALFSEATAWTPLASLPSAIALVSAQASIVGGRLRVIGETAEVMICRLCSEYKVSAS